MLRKRKLSDGDIDEPRSISTKRRKGSHSESDFEEDTSSEDAADSDVARVEKISDDNVKGRPSEMPGALQSPRPRSSRSRAPKKADGPSVRLLVKDRKSLKLCLRVNPTALSRIVPAEPQRKRRRPNRPPEPPPKQQRQPPPPPPPLLQPPSSQQRQQQQQQQQQQQRAASQPTQFTTSYAAPFYSFHERENDELRSKPYGGILSETEADTSKTLPQPSDRERFNEAKRKAEDAWNKKSADSAGENLNGSSQKVAGPASKIQCVNFGGFEIDTWYAAPYPEEYSRNRVLYICEFCLKYMNSDYVAWRHKVGESSSVQRLGA